MPVRVVVSPQVITLTRVQTLYHVIKEIVEAVAGFPSPEIIRRGIVDQPLLEAIYVLLVNARREKVAEINLRIDWRKHQVFANAKGMDDFEFDSRAPIVEQLSKALGEIKKFMTRFRLEQGVSAEVWYGVRSDAGIKYEEACRQLGLMTGSAKELEWAKGKYVRATFAANRLEELRIEMRAKVE